MDFLEIRRKAKERAAAGEAGQGRDAPEPAAPPAPVAAQPEPLSAPPADAPADPPPGEPDPRFTTWRPGAGDRPFIPDPAPASAPRPEPTGFAVIDPAMLRKPPEPKGPITIPPVASPASAPRPEPRAERAPASPRRPSPERSALEEFFYREDEDLPGLVALPGEAEAPALAHEDGGIEEYLTFQLGDEEYAVAIERVREVLKAQTITEVPRAPAAILGVVTVRGEVVAVFDPRRRLGLPGKPPAPGTGRIVIVDDGEGPCGLLVDAVASVVRLAAGSIEPCPQGIGGASADCLSGIGREKQRLFTVLDLAALLRRAPAAPRGGRVHAGA
jgi:purine-binding chemotaxis protein CheW